jgi:pimeloyl-ACP methyl ester carboxylesterase
MTKKTKVLIIISVCIGLYFIGPQPAKPLFNPSLPIIPEIIQLESFIANQESAYKLKPDNQARIVWANDSSKSKTEYAIVYLHGFSASQEEGNPVHRNIAQKFGCNLYLSRLTQHGIDTTEQLLGLTADDYWESAKQALFIGKKLGNKVILMGTSTGASQALQLAAAYPNDVAGLVLYSPNIEINNPNAWLLNNPWGLQIARLVIGSDYLTPKDTTKVYAKYWNTPYRLEATVSLQEMIETTMLPETFHKIKQPVLMLYYYQDENHQDKIVKVSAMEKMFDQLGTAQNQKVKHPIPNAGDHVLCSPIKSGAVNEVENFTEQFLKQVLNIKNQ